MTLENVTHAVWKLETFIFAEEIGQESQNWLGVRDDFRNWLLTAE